MITFLLAAVGQQVYIAVDKKKLKTQMWYHYCHRNSHNMADCKAIMAVKKHKEAQDWFSGKKALPFFAKEINALKKQLKPSKAENRKEAESLLSTEINLSDGNDEIKDYFSSSYLVLLK
jgi:hypothetical protein